MRFTIDLKGSKEAQFAISQDFLTRNERSASISPEKCVHLLTLIATPQLTPNRESYQLSKPEKECYVMEEMYAALCRCTCAEETTFLGKDDCGEEMHLEECSRP